MMGSCSWLLTKNGTAYTLASLDEDSCETFATTSEEEMAAEIIEHLRAQNYRGEPILLAIGSQDCLAVTFAHDEKPTRWDRQTLCYALEEHLPLAAEDFAADFVLFEQESLGVAVEIETLEPLINDLLQEGIHFTSIVPEVLLALSTRAPTTETILLWQTGVSIELLHLVDGKPRVWRSLALHPLSRCKQALRRELDFLAMGREQPLSVIGYNLNSELVEMADEVLDVCWEDALNESARQIASGQMIPLINLAQNGLSCGASQRLIRRELMLFAAAAILFCISLVGGLLNLAHRYDLAASRADNQQRELYRGLFPGQRVPVGIHSRLRSEQQKLAGTVGNSQRMPHFESATELLCQAIGELPDDFRYRLNEIRVDGGKVNLEGEVRRHGDADRLVASLRAANFDVAPPRTENSGEGVAMTISANVRSDDDKEKQP